MMGGQSVKLNRSIAEHEISIVKEILKINDQSKRATLVARIIVGINEGTDSLSLAKNIVEDFNFSQSRDPVGTTRSTIIRIIKDLNGGETCEEVLLKRGRGNIELIKWNEHKIKQLLCELHATLKEDFNYTNVKRSNIKLISIIENKMRFQDALRSSGINPAVHLDDFDWGQEQQTKLFLKKFLREIERRCGIDSLNYHSMYSDQSSIIGIEHNAHADFEACRQYCCIKRISGAAIIRKIESLYGSYKKGIMDLLEITDAQYSNQIEKKKHNINLTEYLSEFEQFILNSGTQWTIANFAESQRTVHHGLHNKKAELTFIEECEHDAVVAAYAEIKFLTSNLSKENFAELQLSQHIRDVKNRRVTNPQTRLEGYNFQRLFLEMITSTDTGLRQNIDFDYEKEIDRTLCGKLGHDKICKIDFKFNNLIIDTKRTLRKTAKISQQLLRYRDHCDKLLIVTMRQNFEYDINDEFTVPVITVFDFIQNSKKYIGKNISESWVQTFENYGREASIRIQKNY